MHARTLCRACRCTVHICPCALAMHTSTLHRLSAALGDRKIRELQFWCHGNQGNIYCGGMPVRADDFAPLRGRVADGGRIWLRSCTTADGAAGRAFVERVARAAGARFAAAHEVVIHVTHDRMVLYDVAAASWAGPVRTALCDPQARVHHFFPQAS